MKDLPSSEDSLVVRTDFSNDAAWASICSEIEAPVGEFQAYVSFVSDPDYDSLSISDLSALGQRASLTFMFVVDQTTLADAEHPILVLDLWDEPGRTFRVVPREMWGVENNLSIANMDFAALPIARTPMGSSADSPTPEGKLCLTRKVTVAPCWDRS